MASRGIKSLAIVGGSTELAPMHSDGKLAADGWAGELLVLIEAFGGEIAAAAVVAIFDY